MPPASYVNYTLDYPPWALDFDPYNRGYLLLGGGGGQGQKEIPNKLTLLDLSDRSVLHKAAEVDVEGDAPWSIGLLAAKDGLFIYTGINSSPEDRKSGKNQHLRTFRALFPPRSRGDDKTDTTASIVPLSKADLFSSSYASSDDAFQRILRLSPARFRANGSRRIAAIASSLAPKSEIVLFDATVAAPTQKDIIHRIEPVGNAEANDLDIYESSEGNFRLAYCTKTAIYLTAVSYDFSKRRPSSKIADPECLHEILSKPAKLVSLRFISEHHILLLLQRAGQSELLVLKIYDKGGPGDVVLRMRLPKRTGSAVSMDVAILDSDATTGKSQVAVAVAAQSRDISILTIDVPAIGSLKGFKPYAEHRNVHDAPMKKVVFSAFASPYDTLDAMSTNGKAKSTAKAPGPQYLRLASISLSNNVVVDTLPLETVQTKSGKPRYVLDKSGPIARAMHASSNLFVFAFILLVTLILTQSYLDSSAPEGQVSKYQILPSPLRVFMSRAREDNDPLKHVIHEAVGSSSEPRHKLRDLLHRHQNTLPSAKKAIVIRPAKEGATELAADVHADHKAAVEDPHAKRWDELTTKQQETWKRRLSKAGRWSADEGDTILKSIFFSEVAGAVGRAAMGAMA